MTVTPQAQGYTSLSVSLAELRILEAALDSHIYWQLSDMRYRKDGGVIGKGSDDPDRRKELRKAERIANGLQAALAAEAGRS